MTKLNTKHLTRCIQTLNYAFSHLNSSIEGTVEHEVFRNAVIKGFELTLETSGKLLRKVLKTYENVQVVNALTYKDLLRKAVQYAILMPPEVERWFEYRDHRNDTAHEYGESFANDVLGFLPQFLEDAETLAQTLSGKEVV